MADHRWQFHRLGGFDQVALRDAADLRALGTLDWQLWSALACPVKGLEADPRTLALLDGDGDGRIRAPEVLAAVAFVCEVLRDPGLVLRRGDGVRVADLASSAGAAALAGAMRELLAALGRGEGEAVTSADVADRTGLWAKACFHGDGILTAASAGEDADAAGLLAAIVAALGGTPNCAGVDGVDAVKISAFFDAAAAQLAWEERGLAEATAWPLPGEKMAAAAAAIDAIAPKIDDFFARGKLAAFDERALPHLEGSGDDLAVAARGLITASCEALRPLPLARPGAGAALPLRAGVNPAWAAELAALRADAIEPLLGAAETLGEDAWAALGARLAPWRAWQAARPAQALGETTHGQLRAWLAGDVRARLDALVAAEEAQRPAFEAMAALERLVLYRRDLGELLDNFVNLRAFYDPERRAVFQAGALYIDQRRCDFVVPVADAGRHGLLAGQSGAYLAYVDCTRRVDGKAATFCAMITDGDADSLVVGRNGVFVDRAGDDWDATLSKVVANPLSIREAFWTPYKRFIRLIEEQLAKRAADADAAAQGKLAGAAEAAAHADKAAPSAAKAEAPKKIDIGTVAALGVAVGGITAALGVLLQALLGLGWLMPLGVFGMMLLVSGPSMAIAALKLRRRSIGPILDANGWAVNAAARLSWPFGATLTTLGALPAGAECHLDDPYAERKRRWPWLLALVAVLGAALYFGGPLHGWTDGAIGQRLPGVEAAATTK